MDIALEKQEITATNIAAQQLVSYALSKGLIQSGDERWAYNRILECCGLWGGSETLLQNHDANFSLDELLSQLAIAGVRAGQAENSSAGIDRIRTRILGSIMPRPSEIAQQFWNLYQTDGSAAATDWFYQLCCDADYVRLSSIARNICWTHASRWGDIEITINRSKPEKDPRDIATAAQSHVQGQYPACQLCLENEGYSGRPARIEGGHPARQNLRIIPLELSGESWGLQYSPYAYYREHCIVMSSIHRPMHIDGQTIARLIDFVERFPHYFVGSNADLPIVGGSILSHDHFQGGAHIFAMAEAPVAESFVLAGMQDVEAEVLNWPLSVIRLRSRSRDTLIVAALKVIDSWRCWSDETVGIVACDANGTRHNTVTPICRRCGMSYELDLALRCNITTTEHPLGVFHPHEDKWHVKKENIGLIEVMGLAILPPRLEEDLKTQKISRQEIGEVFVGALEDAGVFKWDDAGRAALHRFIKELSA